MLASLLIAAWTLATAAQPRQHVLDLTALPNPKSSLRSGGSPCAGGNSGADVKRSAQLQVTLLPLARAEYFIGGHIVFDVVVANTATEAVEFPWARFGDIPKVDPASLVEATIALSTSDNVGKAHQLVGMTLQGSAQRAGSILRIEPGESVRIRIPGWIMAAGRDFDALTDGNGRTTELHAVVAVSPERCRWTFAVKSEGVPVILRVSR